MRPSRRAVKGVKSFEAKAEFCGSSDRAGGSDAGVVLAGAIVRLAKALARTARFDGVLRYPGVTADASGVDVATGRAEERGGIQESSRLV